MGTMSPLLLVNAIDMPEEWGVVGVIVVIVVWLLWWSRKDSMAMARRADAANDFVRQIVGHDREISTRQTEALVATANGLHQLHREVQQDAERSRDEHQKIIEALGAVCRSKEGER